MVRVSKGGENHEFSQQRRGEVAAGELFGLFLPGFPTAPQLGELGYYPPLPRQAEHYPSMARSVGLTPRIFGAARRKKRQPKYRINLNSQVSVVC